MVFFEQPCMNTGGEGEHTEMIQGTPSVVPWKQPKNWPSMIRLYMVKPHENDKLLRRHLS
jgi:hypothetical protein